MIKIKRNPNGDTRTAKGNVTFEEFQTANDMHIQDVKNAMYQLAHIMMNIGDIHDITKKNLEKQFYSDFLDTMRTGKSFVWGKWYQTHIKAERHHLNARCPEDVNLLDVIEMITDCACAGIARSGEVSEIEISEDILKRATANTVSLIKNMIEGE
jgi:hypothetical protein